MLILPNYSARFHLPLISNFFKAALITSTAKICRFWVALFSIVAVQSAFAQDNAWREAKNCVEINSASDDYGPAGWNSAKIYFTSERNGRPLIYSSALNAADAYGEPELARGKLNPERGGISYLSFIPNGGAYVSAFRMADGRPRLNIASTEIIGEAWRAPTFLPEFLSDHFTAHAVVSPDGAIMAFSSDREGGIGGTDIWFSYRLPSGSWGTPIHGGEIINSPGHEITPFWGANDTLYFASDGFGGAGGFEIYKSALSEGVWSPPVPLSELNTEYNESDFSLISADSALFSSDRPNGRGGLDIYLATRGNAHSAATPANIETSLSVQIPSITARSFAPKTRPVLTFALFAKNSGNFSLKSTLDSSVKESLQIIAQRMASNPDVVLTLTGWTDKSTPNETLELAARRAEAIRAFLVKYGVGRDRILIRALEHPKGTRENELLYRVDFNSSDDNIFRRLDDSREGNENYEPPILEFIADARPRSVVKSWICLAGNDTLAKGDAIPSKFTAQTAAACKHISDALILTLQVTDTLNGKYQSETTLPIIKIAIGSTKQLSADAVATAYDSSIIIETAQQFLAQTNNSKNRIILLAAGSAKERDDAEKACDVLRQSYGAGRVALQRTDNFNDMLPKGFSQYSQSLILLVLDRAN